MDATEIETVGMFQDLCNRTHFHFSLAYLPASNLVNEDLSPLTAAACMGVISFVSRRDMVLYIPLLSLIYNK